MMPEWKSPDEITQIIQQNPNQEWHERGVGVLQAAIEEWQKHKKDQKTEVPPSRFGKRFFYRKKDEESVPQIEKPTPPSTIDIKPTSPPTPIKTEIPHAPPPEQIPSQSSPQQNPQEQARRQDEEEKITKPREDKRRQEKPKRKRGVDTLELVKEGINDVFREAVLKLMKEGRFTTPQRQKEAQDFVNDDAKFTFGGSTIGDMLVAQGERRGLKKGDLEDAVVTAATGLWKRALKKIAEKGGSWEDNYDVGISHLFQVAARSAITDAITWERKYGRERPFGSFEEDEDMPYETYDPGSIEALEDKSSPYVDIIDTANQLLQQQLKEETHKQKKTGDSHLLPKIATLLLPHLEWKRAEEKEGMSGLKEMFVHAANSVLEEGVNSSDEKLLDYFIGNGHLQRLMSTFVRFLGLIVTGKESEAEEMARKNKIPAMYQLFQESQKKGLDLFSVQNLCRRGWKSLQRKYTKASPPKPSFTGPIRDSLDRRDCYKDGQKVPCEQFGGEGQGWGQLRSQEDLYDAVRRLIDELKSGSHDGWHELTGLLVHTPIEDLQRLKQEHNLYAPGNVKEALTQRLQEELAHVGHQVQQQQPGVQ